MERRVKSVRRKNKSRSKKNIKSLCKDMNFCRYTEIILHAIKTFKIATTFWQLSCILSPILML